MTNYCKDCGCKSYGGHCVNCHEETFIFEQAQSLENFEGFSKEFLDKVNEQENEAKRMKETF